MSDSGEIPAASTRSTGALAWWGVCGFVVLALTVALVVAGVQGVLDVVDFHRVATAVLVGVLVIAANALGVALAARDFDTSQALTLRGYAGPAFDTDDGYLTYVARKLRVLFVALAPLCVVLFLYVLAFVAVGVLHPMTLAYLLLTIPFGLVHGGTQGVLARLLVNGTLPGAMLMIVGLLLEALLPLVCCLPTFNLPLTAYFMVEPAEGIGAVGGQANYLTAMLLALGFSAATQLIATAICVGIGAWRFRKLQAATREAKGREGKEPCRHCGERIDPERVTCPMCGEDRPFG